jgi:hypothetical protein
MITFDITKNVDIVGDLPYVYYKATVEKDSKMVDWDFFFSKTKAEEFVENTILTLMLSLGNDTKR